MYRWTFDDRPTAQQMREIADVLRDGGVVLLPTDTIYGLHAVASSNDAVERIARIKGRDADKPFIALAARTGALAELGVVMDSGTAEALDSLWPAPLTVILPLAQPIAASRGRASLAVRIPALDWLRELLGQIGPLVSTSANLSGEPPLTSPANAAQGLLNSVDGVADQGLLANEPSAILDLCADPPFFVREGHTAFTQKVWKRLRKTL